MNKALNYLQSISLSDAEMRKLVHGKCNLMSYDQVAKCRNIDQVLGRHRACIILYLTKPGYGHWCCIFEVSPGVLEFFDPYGKMPDETLEYEIDDKFRKQVNQDYTHLLDMMYNSPYNLTYNHHQFQKKKDDVNTCGRHCAVRLMCRNIPLDVYIKAFKGLDADKTVTFLTSYINI